MAISWACLVSARILGTVAVAGALGAGSVSRESSCAAAVGAGTGNAARGEGGVGGDQGHALFVAGFPPERLAAFRRDLLDQPLSGEAAHHLGGGPALEAIRQG
jgi:hypothetical protein